ncbi:MAG: PLDc_N domain-containing protein [Anaerolineaceae bacterium]|nr:PLDc_N domain-containing protein [Anaerolineaceae bacterium]
MNSLTIGLDELMKFLPLLIPLFLIELGVVIFALVDLSKREHTNGSKLMWVFIIVLFNLIGSVVYFIVGRKEE